VKLLILKNYKMSIFEYIKISYTLVSMTNFFDTCKKTPNVIK